ncbi:C-X-C chemokine receptor type 6 [Tiliqua scincoides]|uniref:C-X-C chemokine receptor type 6 n=1 Tax=Tiliqua scincoides TaxID=71010 RepID=UPI003461D9E4
MGTENNTSMLDYEEYLNARLNEEDPNNNFEKFSKVFLVCMYAFACIFGVSGNFLVLIIFIFYEKVKMVTDVFLVSLATADLFFLGTLPFWAYAAADEWIFGSQACKIIRGLYALNLHGSMLTLTCVTIYRCLAIVRATKAHPSETKRKVWGIATCIVVWVISLAFASPQFKYSTESKYDKKICHANYPDNMELYLESLQMALGFFGPMFVMVICYSAIINTLLRVKGFQKHKSLKIIFAIVVTFVLTQTPYNLLKLVRAVHPRVVMDFSFDYALIVTEAIAYFHSCLNPVLYFFIGVKFRKNLAKILKNIGCVKHQRIVKQWQTTDDDGSKTYTASHNAEETSMYPL